MEPAGKMTCWGGEPGRGLCRVHRPRRRAEGFTLVELMVVLALIVLISAITLPSVARMFESGADAMTYNQVAAHLEAGRGYALESGKPAGIHVQLADAVANPRLEGVQYITVVGRGTGTVEISSGTATGGGTNTLQDTGASWNPDGCVDFVVKMTGSGEERTIVSNTPDTLTVSQDWDFPPVNGDGYTITDPVARFSQAPGHTPHPMPGSKAVGDAANFSTGGNWQTISDAQLTGIGLSAGERCFTRFSMIFTSTGVLVRTLGGDKVKFTTSGNGLFSGTTQLWAPLPENQSEEGTTALTIFDYGYVRTLTPAERQTHLNQAAQYLPINFYTGTLYLRKGQ